ncbi:MAG TPA: hypothetical protein VLB90_00945 [Pseudomonadales bacterium]|nr:hypothetical protein [Pseudomonadales bacterium]
MQFSTIKLSSLMQFTTPNRHILEDNQMQHVFDGFKLNQIVINNIQQLIHLLADIQRHRACSLGILSGNDSFDTQVTSLHKKINARLIFLNSQTELTDVVDPYEWDHVLSEWKVVGYGWRGDNVLHNFELHSHLLEKILNIIRHAGRWVLRSGGYSEEAADHYLGHSVFEFVFTTHLYQIETLGRLRGLSTHIANSGCGDNSNGDNAMQIRVKYLLQCAREELNVSSEFLDSHAASISKNIPAVMDIQRSKTMLHEWLELTNRILLGQLEPSDKLARQTFDLASAVMDARLAFTEQILAYLHLAIEEMLESLLEETVALKPIAS